MDQYHEQHNIQKNNVKRTNHIVEDSKYYYSRPSIGGLMMTLPNRSWPVGRVGGDIIVDIESELRGMTFDKSKAPCDNYKPNSANISHMLFGEQTRSFRQGTETLVFKSGNTSVKMLPPYLSQSY
jgi:hypothetical protein